MSDPLLDRIRDLESRLARVEGRLARAEEKPEALTIDDVARLLRISRMTLFRMLKPTHKRYDAAFAACSYKTGDARRFDPIRIEEYRKSRTRDGQWVSGLSS